MITTTTAQSIRSAFAARALVPCTIGYFVLRQGIAGDEVCADVVGAVWLVFANGSTTYYRDDADAEVITSVANCLNIDADSVVALRDGFRGRPAVEPADAYNLGASLRTEMGA